MYVRIKEYFFVRPPPPQMSIPQSNMTLFMSPVEPWSSLLWSHKQTCSLFILFARGFWALTYILWLSSPIDLPSYDLARRRSGNPMGGLWYGASPWSSCYKFDGEGRDQMAPPLKFFSQKNHSFPPRYQAWVLLLVPSFPAYLSADFPNMSVVDREKYFPGYPIIISIWMNPPLYFPQLHLVLTPGLSGPSRGHLHHFPGGALQRLQHSADSRLKSRQHSSEIHTPLSPNLMTGHQSHRAPPLQIVLFSSHLSEFFASGKTDGQDSLGLESAAEEIEREAGRIGREILWWWRGSDLPVLVNALRECPPVWGCSNEFHRWLDSRVL